MFVIALLLGLAGCGGAEAPSGSGGPAPALVRVEAVAEGDLVQAWAAVAEVSPLDAAELAVGEGGPVARVSVREGDAVRAGDVLLEVDPSLARARVDAAEAAVRVAEVELERVRAASTRRDAVARGVLADEELADARAAAAAQEARVAGLRAAAAEARATLERHRIRAPFDGVLTERRADRGDWVQAGAPLLSVVSIGAVEVRVRVPRELAERLTVGTTVQVGGGAGEIVARVPAVDPGTRTALLRIAPDPALHLAPGSAVDVQLPIAWEGVGVRVSRDALLLDPRETRVLKVVEGAAVSVPVEVVATTEREALVLSDALRPGDRVITRGNERVRPGQPLRIEGES